jgi:uncharacterized membrane protein YphA (DoxX/SURF4 family)
MSLQNVKNNQGSVKTKETTMKAVNNLSPHTHWFLRAAIASVFIYHGVGKFASLSQMAAMMKMSVAMLLWVPIFLQRVSECFE